MEPWVEQAVRRQVGDHQQLPRRLDDGLQPESRHRGLGRKHIRVRRREHERRLRHDGRQLSFARLHQQRAQPGELQGRHLPTAERSGDRPALPEQRQRQSVGERLAISLALGLRKVGTQ